MKLIELITNKTIILIIISLIVSCSNFKFAYSAEPSSTPTADVNSCNQKASQLGEYISIVQTNLKLLFDDYNDGISIPAPFNPGSTVIMNRKYWKNSNEVAYPSNFQTVELSWSALAPWKWWQAEYYSVLDNLLKDKPDKNGKSGKSLMKEAWENIKKAAAVNDEMEKLGCNDNTPVSINSYAHPDTQTQTTYGDIKQTIIPHLKKISGQVQNLQTTTSGTPYNATKCEKECKKNIKPDWLATGYCPALCLVVEAFTTFIEWTIMVLYSAAGVS